MPYKSENIKIEGTKHDRRIKLTEEDKIEIVRIRKETDMSYNEIAQAFGVSKRLIIFVCNPEKQKKNVEQRKARGGTMQYYDKEKRKEVQKEHRKYKQALYKKGKIKPTLG